MYVLAKCIKCDGITVMDIGNRTIEQVEKILSQSQFGHCQAGGFHVEIGTMDQYYRINWDTIRATEDEARELIQGGGDIQWGISIS